MSPRGNANAPSNAPFAQDLFSFSDDEQDEEGDVIEEFVPEYGVVYSIPGQGECVCVLLGVDIYDEETDSNEFVPIPGAYAFLSTVGNPEQVCCEPLIPWNSMVRFEEAVDFYYPDSVSSMTPAERVEGNFGLEEQPKVIFHGMTLIDCEGSQVWNVNLVNGVRVVTCNEM
jgi:hypothetical protein